MAGERWLCAAVAAAVALGGGGAQADIINGDFSIAALDGSAGWLAEVQHPVGKPAMALVEVDGLGRLHLKTEFLYTWDPSAPTGDWQNSFGAWVIRESDASGVSVMQAVPADGEGLYAPSGTTEIEFDAIINLTNNYPPDNPGAINVGTGVIFQISYSGSFFPPGGGLMGETDGKVTIEMPDADQVFDDPEGIGLVLLTASTLSAGPEHVEGTDSFTITVEASFDNFRFVPEPMSAGLVVAGAAALLLRPRRRGA